MSPAIAIGVIILPVGGLLTLRKNDETRATYFSIIRMLRVDCYLFHIFKTYKQIMSDDSEDHPIYVTSIWTFGHFNTNFLTKMCRCLEWLISWIERTKRHFTWVSSFSWNFEHPEWHFHSNSLRAPRNQSPWSSPSSGSNQILDHLRFWHPVRFPLCTSFRLFSVSSPWKLHVGVDVSNSVSNRVSNRLVSARILEWFFISQMNIN